MVQVDRESERRVLVVDDNPAIHRLFARILAPPRVNDDELSRMKAALLGDLGEHEPWSGFAVASAMHGQDALALVEAALADGRPYALAFVDMNMPPGWDGLETIQRIWEKTPELQVVICTAYSDYAWSEIVARLRAHSENLLILKKPIDPIEVVQIAHALTRKWALHRASARAREELEAAVRLRTLELAEANARLEEQIRDRERIETDLRLAQKLEAVGQLASGIAHEINTPMQYVGDGVHFLQRTLEPVVAAVAQIDEALATPGDDLAERVARVVASARLPYVQKRVPRAFERTVEGIKRVSAIVRAMKEFAHPDQGEQSPADLSHALENALLVARNEYKYFADVETDLPPLPPVMCLLGELNQAFLNLIINAAHAIEAVAGRGGTQRGKITVKAGVDGDTAWVTIADTGCGIPKEIAGRVFDPFFTTKAVGKGTGQGLPIARSIIVDKHGGRLSFSTEVGRGTTFRIELPVGGRRADSVGVPAAKAAS